MVKMRKYSGSMNNDVMILLVGMEKGEDYPLSKVVHWAVICLHSLERKRLQN
jgi:hypothetical protein